MNRAAHSGCRLQEQFGYGYDAAWNLTKRTNNALVQQWLKAARNPQTIVSPNAPCNMSLHGMFN